LYVPQLDTVRTILGKVMMGLFCEPAFGALRPSLRERRSEQ
jgi:hypothetical protein